MAWFPGGVVNSGFLNLSNLRSSKTRQGASQVAKWSMHWYMQEMHEGMARGKRNSVSNCLVLALLFINANFGEYLSKICI